MISGTSGEPLGGLGISGETLAGLGTSLEPLGGFGAVLDQFLELLRPGPPGREVMWGGRGLRQRFSEGWGPTMMGTSTRDQLLRTRTETLRI